MPAANEGELYDFADEAFQRMSRFDGPVHVSARATLSERLRVHANRPGERAELRVLVASL